MRSVTVLSCLAFPAEALGDRIEAKAMRILAGDALMVRDTETKKLHVIRLAGINAPVRGQPYYDTSRASLYRLTRRKLLSIEWDKYDDRCLKEKKPTTMCEKVARVVADGTDVSLEQVKRGLAWHNVRRLEEQSTPDRTLYSEAEAEARKRRRGLWRSRNPVPPWKFKGGTGQSKTQP